MFVLILFFSFFQELLSDEPKEEDKLVEAASRLTEIADEIPFAPPEVESDSKSEEGQC